MQTHTNEANNSAVLTRSLVSRQNHLVRVKESVDKELEAINFLLQIHVHGVENVEEIPHQENTIIKRRRKGRGNMPQLQEKILKLLKEKRFLTLDDAYKSLESSYSLVEKEKLYQAIWHVLARNLLKEGIVEKKPMNGKKVVYFLTEK